MRPRKRRRSFETAFVSPLSLLPLPMVNFSFSKQEFSYFVHVTIYYLNLHNFFLLWNDAPEIISMFVSLHRLKKIVKRKSNWPILNLSWSAKWFHFPFFQLRHWQWQFWASSGVHCWSCFQTNRFYSFSFTQFHCMCITNYLMINFYLCCIFLTTW
jgi:hypothetical protein